MFVFTKEQKAKKAIKEQFKAMSLLKKQLRKQYSTQELNDLNQAQVQTSLNQLYLVNQAIRKEYNLTDSSYKLDGAPGIVFHGSRSQYNGLILHQHSIYTWFLSCSSYVGYLTRAQKYAVMKRVAKDNRKVSDLLQLPIPLDNLFIWSFHLQLTDTNETVVPIYYTDEMPISVLEALASYHKKDVVLLS